MSSTYREVVLIPYLSRAEAAAYLGVTDRTIDRYIANGDIQAVRIGKRLIRIPLESVEAFVSRDAK